MSQRQLFYWFKKEDTLIIYLDCLSFNLYFKSNDLLLYIQNNRSTFALQDEGSSRSQNAVEHSESTRPTGHEKPPPHKTVILRLMEDFITKKSSNEHGFFAAVTSLNKIGEGRIQDLTGDIPFLVQISCAETQQRWDIGGNNDTVPHICLAQVCN